MSTSIRHPIAFSILISISGCGTWNEWHMETAVEKMRGEAFETIDFDACELTGAMVEGIGMLGIPSCVAYYSDGGKTCTDKSQCQGYCYLPELKEEGMALTGVCESSEHDGFGCFSRIENGVVAYAMCQD